MIPISPAQNIYKRGSQKSVTSQLGKRKNTTPNTRSMLSIFPAITDINENSIFIYACMSASIAEFMRLTIVKIPIIAIPLRTRGELYPGRKYATPSARKNITTPRSNRSVRTFPIMVAVFCLFCVISRIVIV